MTPSNNLTTYFGPPKPNAIATIIMTSSYNNHPKKKIEKEEETLSSIQTLLYSIQKSMETNNNGDNNNDKKKGYESYSYPPEIIVLLIDNNKDMSKNIEYIKQELACFCTRVIYIQKEIPSPQHHQYINGTIQLLNQVVYNLILYIDSNCLVQNNVCHLFQQQQHQQNIMYNGLNGLMNAVSAPMIADDYNNDQYEKDFFDTTVMMIKPCYEVYNNMIHKLLQLCNQSVQSTHNHHYDDKHNEDQISVRSYCNQFWNQYFQQNWYQFDKKYRLGIEYNYYENNHCMISRRNILQGEEKKKKFNVIYIYNKKYYSHDNRLFINQLYSKWTKKSMIYKENYKEKQHLVQRAKKDMELRKMNQGLNAMMKNNISSPIQPTTTSSRHHQMDKHKLVSKRYKELRKQGNNPKDAMRIARSDYGMDKDDENQTSVNTQVASMFGMGGLF